ncbi:MAG TPA: primosomal protein N', partial [Pirellulaceae bacterium]|nr:primosomal protein N' [Pirellulaceae bacterium]
MQRQGRLFGDEPAPEPWDVDEERDRIVASIVFPTAPWGPFDYLVPESLRANVEPGRRVRVPLGKGDRTLVGYCVGVAPGGGGGRTLKPIRTVLDARPLISPPLLDLARWIAEFYLCELGPVLETVIPAGVRAQAGTREQTFLSVVPSVAARLEELKISPKQKAILRALYASGQSLTAAELARAAGCSTAPIQQLRAKGLVREDVRRVTTAELHESVATPESPLVLNPDQAQALAAIRDAIDGGRSETILLHGVTGSGKTEVYIQAIDDVLRRGRQAIVLVPEISLTPQTRQRFRARFPHVAVLHSHQSDVERNAHWQRIARGEAQVVVGARSAVFAPVPRLGLIVIDEEHDASFKQDSIPRYHAREAARRRCEQEGAPLVLGSATPSLESWRRAQLGEYRLVDMPNRVSRRPLPEVTTIDMKGEFRRGFRRGALSRQLDQSIKAALADDGQVILLLNRRGFATSIQCPSCGYVARCPDCDLALTHHRSDSVAICHYCDYQIRAPDACPDCKFEGIRFAGLGTEKLEEEVKGRFPGQIVLRMDSDTMRKPGSHEAALAQFRAGEARILIGTQMIAKGLDFPNVTLVGVVNADTALHFPDFRAAERTFQLVTQVAGRTGRGDRGGHVILQTSTPEHPAIQAAARHDYLMFAQRELPEREQFGYPPFTTLVRIIIRGSSTPQTESFADVLTERLRGALEAAGVTARILGPAPCPIERLRGKSRFHTLIQSADSDGLRAVLRSALATLDQPDNLQWLVDIDPLEML